MNYDSFLPITRQSKDLVNFAKNHCQRKQISMSELIRRALTQYLLKNK